MHSHRNKENAVPCLYQTVKKTKQMSQLNHVKSYDDIFSVHELQPFQVKILLNNDRSLKNICKAQQTQKYPNFQLNIHDETSKLCSHRQSKQTLSQVLQQSVKKQNLLIQKNLFDPYKYFGSGAQTTNIQETARHHQSRLQAMFSQNNSPAPTDHSASYRKKSPFMKNSTPKINIDANRISNSVLFSKLQKLGQIQKKTRQNSHTKIKYNQKSSTKDSNDKENHRPNEFLYESNQKMKNTDKKLEKYQQNVNMHYQSSKNTQNYENSSFHSNKKMSVQNKSSTYRSNQVNCSPKSYVKEAKQNYLKMNINNLQKVRLKLKLTSKN